MDSTTLSDVMISSLCDFSILNETLEIDTSWISDENDFNYYISGPMLTIFIILGILGNSICLYVFRPFRTHKSPPPIFIYLFALAVWDLTLLCASFFLYSMPEFTHGSILMNPDYVFMKPYIYCATNAAHTNAIWMVVALGFERYIALCHPFKHRLLNDNRRRAIYVVVIISIAAVLYSIPRLFELLYDTTTNIPACIIKDENTYEIWSIAPHERATVRQNFFYRTLYKLVGGTLLYSIGPFLCLLIVSVRVSAAIRQQRSFQRESRQKNHCPRRRSSSSNRDQCSYSVNIMLVLVMVKLLFVHALATALDVAEMIMGDEEFPNNETIQFLLNFLTLLLAVNSSGNFFIYYACSIRFRNEVKKIRKLDCLRKMCKYKENGVRLRTYKKTVFEVVVNERAVANAEAV